MALPIVPVIIGAAGAASGKMYAETKKKADLRYKGNSKAMNMATESFRANQKQRIKAKTGKK